MPVAFGRLLRRRGLDVPGTAVAAFADSLVALGPGDLDDVYWAGRATLVRRPEDFVTYDTAFRSFFATGVAGDDSRASAPPPVTLAVDDEADETDEPDEADARERDPLVQPLRFSRTEVLRHADLGACTDEERAEVFAVLDRLRVVGGTRRSRRLIAGPHRRGRPDLRRTVRDALRTGGEPMRRRYRTHAQVPRRLVLLLDVSGSMDPYARALARFAHAAVAARRHVEVFTLGTRLTRVTRELGGHDPDLAVAAASGAVADWSGGTRLGDALRAFNDRWGVTGPARGAQVVILSDGWDRGEPEVLGAEMERLARVAHRIVWVNPLKAAPGYEPLARGMAAALPHVDRFVAGHSLASLEQLAAVLASGSDTRHTEPVPFPAAAPSRFGAVAKAAR